MPTQYYWIHDNSSYPPVVRLDMEKSYMTYLMVTIYKYSFDDNPGFAWCKFTDAFGKNHYIYEKIPVVSSEDIWFYNKDTILPQKGYIAGEIIKIENGIINFSTEKPWDIETNENIREFSVFDNQIINELDWELIHNIKNIVDGADIEILNDTSRYLNLYSEINKLLINYKNKNGNQRKAFDTMIELHKLYEKQSIEEKEDFVADVLDMIVGNIGNKDYLIWDGYLKT